MHLVSSFEYSQNNSQILQQQKNATRIVSIIPFFQCLLKKWAFFSFVSPPLVGALRFLLIHYFGKVLGHFTGAKNSAKYMYGSPDPPQQSPTSVKKSSLFAELCRCVEHDLLIVPSCWHLNQNAKDILVGDEFLRWLIRL